MEDIIKVSVVNFYSYWGEKHKNLSRIKGYIRAAAAGGCDIIAFPEMCLTGYENEPEKDKNEKMQILQAEPIPGPSSEEIADLAVELGIYVLFGMPERDKDHPETVYNTVAVTGPEGIIGQCRKIHIPFTESQWSTAGADPFLWETKWGTMGAAICYDVYAFPEIARYAAGTGARIFFNCTAMTDGADVPNNRIQLESMCITNGIYIATANQTGAGRGCSYNGYSSIMGPSAGGIDPCYYAGNPFFSGTGREAGMYTAVIDLSLAREFCRLPIYQTNPWTGKPDFKPGSYEEWYGKLSRKEE